MAVSGCPLFNGIGDLIKGTLGAHLQLLLPEIGAFIYQVPTCTALNPCSKKPFAFSPVSSATVAARSVVPTVLAFALSIDSSRVPADVGTALVEGSFP